MTISSARTARFGPYSLDLRSGELRKFGSKIKMGEQSFRILCLLLDANGEMVTREELRDKLWASDTFVDFDHGLNSAVQRLRDCLSDSAENPRWIATVPRRGYRFVGRVAGARHFRNRVTVRGNRSSRSTVAPRRIVLAVLPFQNLSADPSDEYFSDGLTEEMITQAGGLSPEQLLVIARTTSMTYKHTSKSVQEIGRELGAHYVLESSIRRDGERVRITIQLIRTSDQVQVWTSSYDRHVSGSIMLQEELAREVAARIEVQLSPAYANRSKRSHSDPLANEAYLRGQYFVNQFTAQGYRKAIDYFHQAIDRDPEFAEAYSGLADAYRWLIVTDTIPTSEGGGKMNDAARQAVQLNNSLSESHTALAGALLTFCDWPRAENEFKHANALNPSYPGSHRLYAALLASQKRHREALEEINQAMRLDPLSLPNNAEVVRTLYYARDYDGALAQAQKAMQLDPAYYRTHFWLGRVYAQIGTYQRAVDESERVFNATPDSTLGLTELAYSLATAGRTARARTILRTLEERSRCSWVPAYNLAIIHVALKEDDEALRYLQKAYDEQDWALLVLAVEPRLDRLRSDPRFLELCRKLRFSV